MVTHTVALLIRMIERQEYLFSRVFIIDINIK